MPTVHRADGLRFVIYLNDHEPAHVHAIAGAAEARIELGTAEQNPQVVWVRGMGRALARRALDEVVREAEVFRAAWRRIHEGGEDG